MEAGGSTSSRDPLGVTPAASFNVIQPVRDNQQLEGSCLSVVISAWVRVLSEGGSVHSQDTCRSSVVPLGLLQLPGRPPSRVKHAVASNCHRFLLQSDSSSAVR